MEDTGSTAAEVDKGLPDEPADVSKLQKRRTYGGNKSFWGKNQTTRKKYFFHCGGDYPHQSSCPAQEKTCNKCQKKGHFAQYCRSKSSKLKYENDCVILKRSSNQRNTPLLHNSELSNDKARVSESSDSSKGYVKTSITVTVNS